MRCSHTVLAGKDSYWVLLTTARKPGGIKSIIPSDGLVVMNSFHFVIFISNFVLL